MTIAITLATPVALDVLRPFDDPSGSFLLMSTLPDCARASIKVWHLFLYNPHETINTRVTTKGA